MIRLVLTAILIAIAVEDYIDRKVPVFLFLCLLVFWLVYSKGLFTRGWFINTGVNITGTIVMIAGSFTWVRLRSKSFKDSWGMGDSILLFTISLGIAPSIYFVWIAISAFIAIAVHFILRLPGRCRADFRTIPFLFYLAIGLILILFIKGEAIWTPL